MAETALLCASCRFRSRLRHASVLKLAYHDALHALRALSAGRTTPSAAGPAPTMLRELQQQRRYLTSPSSWPPASRRHAANLELRIRFYSQGRKRGPADVGHAAGKPRAVENVNGVEQNDVRLDQRPTSANGSGKLQARTRRISERVKQRLSTLNSSRENLYTVPNILTFSRLLAAPAVGYLVLHDQHAWAVGLFAYAGITDLVDGWIARKWNQQSVVGSVIDPMADKMLMTILVGCLAVKGALPLWLAAIIFGRDMSLGFAAIYYRYASLPAPKTFTRYWDFSLPSAEVHPTTISKYNTFLQLCLIGGMTALPLANELLLPGNAANITQAVTGMQYLVASTTLWSGLDYVWDKRAVTILGSDEALKKKQGFRGRAIIGVSFAAFAGLAAWLAAQQRDAVGEAEE